MVQIKQSNFKCQDTPNDRTEKKKNQRRTPGVRQIAKIPQVYYGVWIPWICQQNCDSLDPIQNSPYLKICVTDSTENYCWDPGGRRVDFPECDLFPSK